MEDTIRQADEEEDGKSDGGASELHKYVRLANEKRCFCCCCSSKRTNGLSRTFNNSSAGGTEYVARMYGVD